MMFSVHFIERFLLNLEYHMGQKWSKVKCFCTLEEERGPRRIARVEELEVGCSQNLARLQRGTFSPWQNEKSFPLKKNLVSSFFSFSTLSCHHPLS